MRKIIASIVVGIFLSLMLTTSVFATESEYVTPECNNIGEVVEVL